MSVRAILEMINRLDSGLTPIGTLGRVVHVLNITASITVISGLVFLVV